MNAGKSTLYFFLVGVKTNVIYEIAFIQTVQEGTTSFVMIWIFWVQVFSKIAYVLDILIMSEFQAAIIKGVAALN